MKFKDETQKQIWLFDNAFRLQQQAPEILSSILNIKNLPSDIREPLEQGKQQLEKDKKFIQAQILKSKGIQKLRLIQQISNQQEKDQKER